MRHANFASRDGSEREGRGFFSFRTVLAKGEMGVSWP